MTLKYQCHAPGLVEVVTDRNHLGPYHNVAVGVGLGLRPNVSSQACRVLLVLLVGDTPDRSPRCIGGGTDQ